MRNEALDAPYRHIRELFEQELLKRTVGQALQQNVACRITMSGGRDDLAARGPGSSNT